MWLEEAVRFATENETAWPYDLRLHLEGGYFEAPPFNEILGPVRPRLLPLHPALIREGFLDRVDHVRREHGAGAALFPEIKPDKVGQLRTFWELTEKGRKALAATAQKKLPPVDHARRPGTGPLPMDENLASLKLAAAAKRKAERDAHNEG